MIYILFFFVGLSSLHLISAVPQPFDNVFHDVSVDDPGMGVGDPRGCVLVE